MPHDFITTRFGLDFVKLKREGGEPLDIVVQLGEHHEIDGKPGVEILSGLKVGDTLVTP
ncbi:hypothetical protein [Breoghania sp.]|uniref:hypothetical protein n=1 Tax=Breoghania sp. TaxID=2065378 RepID=UPI00261EEA28|nr:hypothetical protein [Breoghania sp.]MDJ0929565.1 hypothetical protein [Breoghania sp.]